MKREYEDIVKNEVQRAISADEDAIAKLCANYIDNIKAYTQREKVRNKYTGQYEEPDERLMRSIEEKIDIPESRKDDFRREIMNYIGALAIEGKTFNYRTNERLHKALELKLFEDQKDSIKLKSLVSRGGQGDAGEDRRREAAADQELRLLRDLLHRRAQLRGLHLRARGCQGVTGTSPGAGDARFSLPRARVGGRMGPDMSLKIKQDHARFREIVRGQIKKNLRKYIQKGEMIGKKGKDFITIPVPTIDIPHFRFGRSSRAAWARARASPATRSRPREGQPASGQAGQGEGAAPARGGHLARGARRDPGRGAGSCPASSPGARTASSPPEVTLHRHLPLRPGVAAPLQAHLQAGLAPPDCERHLQYLRPVVVPMREDRRYRTWKQVPLPETNAVVIYMMDVSGSMGDEQKEIVRIESFWIDTWLRATTRASRPATSSTTRWRARSTGRPSSTPASRAAP